MIDKPSPWETAAVAEMRPRAERLNRRMPPGKRVDFEEAVQMSLVAVVRACRKWAAQSSGKPPEGYLYQAMKNARADEQAKWWRRVEIEPYLYDENVCLWTVAPDPQTLADERLEANQIMRLLEQHGVDVEALKLWALGCSAVEGGEVLEVAPGTFKNRVSAARKKARDVLRREASYLD